jgi:uncharacterized protein (DUF58 family)
MRQLGIAMPVLVLLVMGITIGVVAGEIAVGQQLTRDSAPVGEQVVVNVNFATNGEIPSQVSVTPSLPPGVFTSQPQTQFLMLEPSGQGAINYPVVAQQSGYYDIISVISYTDEAGFQELNMISPFTAT